MSAYDNDHRVHPHPDDGSWMVFSSNPLAEYNVSQNRWGEWNSFDADGNLLSYASGKASMDDAIRALIGEPAMNEPSNVTAWIDWFGDTWVRTDDAPGRYGTWWPLTDGLGWEPWARSGIGQSRGWAEVEEYGPFVEADPDRTARALARVRQEVDQ